MRLFSQLDDLRWLNYHYIVVFVWMINVLSHKWPSSVYFIVQNRTTHIIPIEIHVTLTSSIGKNSAVLLLYSWKVTSYFFFLIAFSINYQMFFFDSFLFYLWEKDTFNFGSYSSITFSFCINIILINFNSTKLHWLNNT